MNAMILEAKKKQVYFDKPTEEQLDTMFKVASGKLFSLTENTRAETLSWHTYIRYLNKSKKKEQQIILLFKLLSLFYHFIIS